MKKILTFLFSLFSFIVFAQIPNNDVYIKPQDIIIKNNYIILDERHYNAYDGNNNLVETKLTLLTTKEAYEELNCSGANNFGDEDAFSKLLTMFFVANSGPKFSNSAKGYYKPISIYLSNINGQWTSITTYVGKDYYKTKVKNTLVIKYDSTGTQIKEILVTK